MRTFILLFTLLPGLALASGGGMHLMDANNDLGDKESLRRGAKLFADYCLSCHSAKYMRYNRMAKDLEISDDDLKANYMYAAEKVGDTMTVAMRPEDAKNWFLGIAPPDLSVTARSRGTDWLYTYMLSFYADEKRPFGVNNRLFADVAMPHVLVGLQGVQKPVYKTEKGNDGKDHQMIDKLEPVDPGKQEAYKKAVTDLVNFMEYLGEPIKISRVGLGIKVILFLLVLLVVSYFLKVEYWRDIR